MTAPETVVAGDLHAEWERILWEALGSSVGAVAAARLFAAPPFHGDLDGWAEQATLVARSTVAPRFHGAFDSMAGFQATLAYAEADRLALPALVTRHLDWDGFAADLWLQVEADFKVARVDGFTVAFDCKGIR